MRGLFNATVSLDDAYWLREPVAEYAKQSPILLTGQH